MHQQIYSYTKSKSSSNGWLWSISFNPRLSYGYVSLSKYISINNAIKEFENTTGIKHENVIKFETRISEQAWKDNVLFPKLSAGFIEPIKCYCKFCGSKAESKIFSLLEDKPDAYNRLINKTYTGIHKWIKALYSM